MKLLLETWRAVCLACSPPDGLCLEFSLGNAPHCSSSRNGGFALFLRACKQMGTDKNERNVGNFPNRPAFERYQVVETCASEVVLFISKFRLSFIFVDFVLSSRGVGRAHCLLMGWCAKFQNSLREIVSSYSSEVSLQVSDTAVLERAVDAERPLVYNESNRRRATFVIAPSLASSAAFRKAGHPLLHRHHHARSMPN